jgi:hypothetical protein
MTISTGSVSDEVVSRVILDSGSNINACNRKLAGLLNVPIQRWKLPFRVLFGNHTEVWSEEFIDLGGLMGRTAIIENCTYTILSVFKSQSERLLCGHEGRNYAMCCCQCSKRCFEWVVLH